MNEFENPPPAPDDPMGERPPSPPPRPLLRRTHHRHVAGVAGGIADYVGVDPTLIRVAFVVLAVFGGSGVLLYLAGWVAMPTQSGRPSHLERWFGRAPNPAAVVAIVGVLFVILATSDHDHGGSGVGWGLALLFAGWLLFRADSRAATVSVPTGDAGVTSAPEASWHGPGGQSSAWSASPAPTPQPPKPPSILGRLTVGIALAAMGLAALLERVSPLTLEPAQYVALALTIVGLGLITGAWMGRAYWLIAVGFLLLPIMLLLAAAPWPMTGGAGDLSYAPQDVEELDATYTLGLGELDLDLTGVNFAAAPGDTTTVSVSVGLGETTITIPADVTVAADVEMRAGNIELFGRRYEGSPFEDPIRATSEGVSGGGHLNLIIDNGVGELTVRRINEER